MSGKSIMKRCVFRSIEMYLVYHVCIYCLMFYIMDTNSVMADPQPQHPTPTEISGADGLLKLHQPPFVHAFIASFSVIIVSELGDKTFFIAAIMAMRHPRLTVFTGAIAALALMTVLSVVFGMAATIIPRVYTYYISTALFAIFGLKMLKDGYYMSATEAAEELEEVQSDLRKREDELMRSMNENRNETVELVPLTEDDEHTVKVAQDLKLNGSLHSIVSLHEIPQPHQQILHMSASASQLASTDSSNNHRINHSSALSLSSGSHQKLNQQQQRQRPRSSINFSGNAANADNSLHNNGGTHTQAPTSSTNSLNMNNNRFEKEVNTGLIQDTETGTIRKAKSPKSAANLLARIFMQAFTMTFLAEWGDRSQLTTIILGARENVYGVIVGGVIGHSICTGLAVIGGRMIAQKISVRTVTLIGGVVFLLFAISSLFFSPNDETEITVAP